MQHVFGMIGVLIINYGAFSGNSVFVRIKVQFFQTAGLDNGFFGDHFMASAAGTGAV